MVAVVYMLFKQKHTVATLPRLIANCAADVDLDLLPFCIGRTRLRNEAKYASLRCTGSMNQSTIAYPHNQAESSCIGIG